MGKMSIEDIKCLLTFTKCMFRTDATFHSVKVVVYDEVSSARFALPTNSLFAAI